MDKNVADPLTELGKKLEEIYLRLSEMAKWIKTHPNEVGWLRLIEVLEETRRDQKIVPSAAASEFVQLMLTLAREAVNVSSVDEAIQPLSAKFISKNSSEIAKKRFKKPREVEQWVVSEWEKHKAEYNRNKTAFARDYTKRIIRERDLPIQERTIRERWLKGL